MSSSMLACKVSVRSYVRNGGRGQLSSEWSHNENDIIMRTGAASSVGARCHNENDITMIIAGLWRYSNWRHVATGCTALVTFMPRNTAWVVTTGLSCLTKIIQNALSMEKIVQFPLPMGGSGPTSNTWFPGPTRVRNLKPHLHDTTGCQTQTGCCCQTRL